MKNKQLRTYLIWAFLLAWILQGAAAWFAARQNAAAFQMILIVVMYAPFAAVLIAKYPLGEMGWVPRLRGNWKWFFAAWLGSAVLMLLGAGLYFLLFPAQLDLSGGALRAQLGEAGIAQLEASGMSVNAYILMQAFSSLTWAPFFNALPAMGEEVGWRGAMYPMLKERFGVRKGRVLGGLIWGVWHWPVMILAGYNYGKVYWGAPLLGPVLFCVFCAALGTLIDLLYEKTRCIWIPALAHGAFNAVAGFPALFLDPAFPDRSTLGPTMIGLIGGLPMILLAVLVLRRGAEPKAE